MQTAALARRKDPTLAKRRCERQPSGLQLDPASRAIIGHSFKRILSLNQESAKRGEVARPISPVVSLSSLSCTPEISGRAACPIRA